METHHKELAKILRAVAAWHSKNPESERLAIGELPHEVVFKKASLKKKIVELLNPKATVGEVIVAWMQSRFPIAANEEISKTVSLLKRMILPCFIESARMQFKPGKAEPVNAEPEFPEVPATDLRDVVGYEIPGTSTSGPPQVMQPIESIQGINSAERPEDDLGEVRIN